MSEQEDRPRGILTPSDRALLRGEVNLKNKQQYSNRRQDIRERIANGLLDFNTIQYLLRDKDRKLIFRDPATAANVDNLSLPESIRSMLYWTYLGLREQNYDFEGLLVEAIEEAEKDYARKYWGESVEATVRFDVDVTRTYDIDDLITAVENGGPVKSNQLYDLLELSRGVPIDTSKLDTLHVWFRSSYPDGEKAVIETLFSEYLGVDVEVKDAVARVELTESDLKKGYSLPKKESAVVDPNQPRPEPSEIKNHRSVMDYDPEETIKEIRLQERLRSPSDKRRTDNVGDQDIMGSAIDDIMDNADTSPQSIHEFIEGNSDTDKRDKTPSPEVVLELLEQVSDPFVSTVEIATALNCVPEAAQQTLSRLQSESRVKSRSVIDTNGDRLGVWWLTTTSPTSNEESG